MLKRAVIILQRELAQSEKRMGGAVLRRQLDELSEGGLAVPEVVERIVRGALVPVALDVVRLQLHELSVQPDGLFPAFCLARFGRGFEQRVKTRATRGRGCGFALGLGCRWALGGRGGR